MTKFDFSLHLLDQINLDNGHLLAKPESSDIVENWSNKQWLIFDWYSSKTFVDGQHRILSNYPYFSTFLFYFSPSPS